MKESYWGYWLIVLGVFIVVIMMIIQSYTSTNQQDYYLLKEAAEASMLEAVDYNYYRQYGEVRINKEKFMENFMLRFAENANMSKTYQISFYDIYESPPKVSIKVTSKSNTFTIAGNAEDFDIVNKVDAILEIETKKSDAN